MADPREQGAKPPFPKQEQETPGSETRMSPKPDHGEESYRGHDRLMGRVALITGGDSGIGRAVALAFAREGADISISYVQGAEEQDAADSCEEVRKSGRLAIATGTDLSLPDSCRNLVEATVKKFGRIDIVVNNAAFQGRMAEKFEDMDAERIQHTFATNIEAMFHIVRYALPHMNEGGIIINSTSIQGYEPSPPILDYACTKAAIVAFTHGLAKELIERGIRVNGVAPGPVWTPLIPQSFDAEQTSKHGESNPMKRPAQPAELAPAYVFLASDESRYITGEVIAVTGGPRTA